MMTWLLFFVLSVNAVENFLCKFSDQPDLSNSRHCMHHVSQSLDKGDISELEDIERTVAKTPTPGPISLAAGYFNVRLHRIPYQFPFPEFEGLEICASEREVLRGCNVSAFIHVQLPAELPVNGIHKFVFNMVSLPQNATSVLVNSPNYLYKNKLIGLSVEGQNVSGLQEFVNISMNITTSQTESHRPQCVFLNYTTNKLDTDGCWTQSGDSHVVCSCNHLTFFGVLMISNQILPKLTQTDVTILTYMTFVGCSISFCALLIAVLLFSMTRSVRSDVSMTIHVNLAIALLLLNMHFLPNTATGIWHFSLPSRWLCLYLAIAVHFSLLASFCWMAVEGFHLYLLLVKVFNIHVRKYLLKVSLVGWGVPVIVVGVVVSINRDFYGYVPILNSTEICYIREDLVENVSVLGLFCLVFLFNLTMLVVMVRNIVGMRKRKQFGPNDCNRAKKDICTLLGVITLLGTTWGLIFFSFGQLGAIGQYAFCILNPLQGLFIFLWFLMAAIKMGKTARHSTETQSSR